jgi:hypothetical protein
MSPHSFQRIQQRLQFFIFDLDEIDCPLSRRFGFRRHRSYFFADEADESVCQDRQIIDTPTDSHARHIFSGDHGFDSRHLQGLAYVDLFDAAIGNRAP